MRAILINPRDRTVHSIDVSDKLEEWRGLVVCETIGRVSLTTDLEMWIDDNGHLTAGKCIFELAPDPTRYAGNALILGCEGPNTVAAFIGLEKLLQLVRWTELLSTGLLTEPTQEGNVITGGQPISGLRPAEPYVIWSNKHRAWWRPGSNGYVPLLKDAGRYSRQHVLQICKNGQGGWDGISPPPSVPVRLIDAIAARLEGRVFG